MDRKSSPLLLGIYLSLFANSSQGLEVLATSTTGQAVNLTIHPAFVHFTATAPAGQTSAVMNANNIPTASVSLGTVFSNFSNTFTNGVNGDGEISAADNPKAVVAQYQASPAASNKQIWFGLTGAAQGVSFNATLPTTSGTIVLYTGGWNQFVPGQASLVVNITTGTPESGNITYTAPTNLHWGAAFTVNWSGRAVNDIMTFQLSTIPLSGSGNAGLIAVVAPEPSTYVLSVLAALGLAATGWKRRYGSKRS